MKYSLVFLLVLGLTSSTPVRHTRSLEDDLNDFLGLLPLEKIVPIVQEYLTNDEEIQKVLEYIQTDDFKNLVKEIEAIEDVVEFLDYLEESGLDVYELLNVFHEIIGLPPLVPGGLRAAITGGMAGLIGDIKDVLPVEEIRALYYEKLETSEDFKKLVERLREPRLQEIVDQLLANKEVQRILKTLEEAGVDLKAIADLLSKILGLKFPNQPGSRAVRSLKDDFYDFVALVPVDEVTPIVLEYVAKDKEVQEAIDYVQTEDFKELVKAVESIEDVLVFYDYLQESGLAVYEYVNKLHELLELPPLVHNRRAVRITGGVAGLVADIKAVLPVEKFKALYYEKLETSPDFKNLIDRLSSPKFQAVVDKVVTNPEFVHIAETAKEHGIDVDAIADLISTILGIKFPDQRRSRSVRGLNEDFEDFVDLIPKDKVLQIFLQYFAEDKEVQEAFVYLQSAEFRELVKAVEAIDDVINFYNYLQESGLDIYEAVNQLHEVIGLPPLVPPRRFSARRITGGVNGLIQDIKAVLPIEDIEALYYEKLETSPEFKKLIERLRSPKFQAVVDTLFANEEFQEILKAAREAGVDLEAVADLLSTIFGLKFPPVPRRVARNLYVDFYDFLALVPQEEVAEIFFEYLLNDKEVQDVMEYIQTPEFRQLVKDVEEIEEVLEFYRYLDESGLNIYYYVNELHKLIGLPELRPKFTGKKMRITGGVAGLIDDILAVLPVEDIKALYYEKLEKSPEFKNLIERLSSPEFQAVVDTVVANKEFQSIVQRARDAGVDVDAIAQLISKILGVHFPRSRAVRTVQSDLEDFLLLLPIDEMVKIGITFLLNDPEVQEAAKYVKSQELRDLLIQLQGEKDILDFLQYFEDSGLNIFTFLDLLNDLLGVPHFPRPPVAGKVTREGPTTGVQGMLNALRAVLPYDEIHALYEEKVETSEEFAYFVERFKQPEFQEIVDRLVVNELFIELGHQAYLHGIEIRHITEFLEELFGIKFPEVPFPPQPEGRAGSDLSADLEEFLQLLPIDDMVRVILTYALTDKETQEALKYLRSEDFRNVVRALDRIPEYLEILKELDAAGLPVYRWIQIIHKLIGLDDKHPYVLRDLEGEPGLSGLIEELKKLLPDEQIKSLYYHKLETSEAFADFVELIKSDKFQTVVNTLFANEDFQNLLHDAQKHGVDLQVIADFFFRVFGITTPPGVIDPPQ